MGDTPTDLDGTARFLSETNDRGLGDAQLRSNLASSRQYLALSEGANNLLTKARRDLAAGRADRAASLIDRALRLPRPVRDEPPVGANEAHMILFSMVCDAMEDSGEHDFTWLDAAEATLPKCGGHARQDLLCALSAINNDYRLERAESRRIHALLPHGADDEYVPSAVENLTDADEATLRAVIIEILQAATVYETELRQLDAAH